MPPVTFNSGHSQFRGQAVCPCHADNVCATWRELEPVFAAELPEYLKPGHCHECIRAVVGVNRVHRGGHPAQLIGIAKGNSLPEAARDVIIGGSYSCNLRCAAPNHRGASIFKWRRADHFFPSVLLLAAAGAASVLASAPAAPVVALLWLA